ncbi:hypothetical protein A2673_03390 [Candidatus Kaiserbacteria bacterium RIFCSPHIGHO2_01_FULL_50_13]|uniref:Transposase IS200-like domain-containing protein n=1 Tax=Candidatus Kaiserbacteria bacterium RIFCSPLOWO2_01_FULL_50_24 TaxID=1798507 RepID=A0A1F6ENH9_9BACT|nr:MAG: hypothetical protein A2673_03390 [Candidatus Kaiserbacteria bacterium RIFCSPHIGHO2_01_FULL_50_13]OGG74872.1 MAG: hypothetical protein A3A34_03565 [Candidatus Kaiserbacteria bacterium RIFCSPLOWO2_01_FULL_50_24]OGG81609.1 MAG: hypothetical protein A3H74_01350 [Candidatus Kaiserbacteria bacterium RIFCSPLOWO2_02_FULL_51_13]
MSIRPVSFAPGEWFHCYNRGVDKRNIFMDEHDAERLQMLLYSSNSDTPIHISNLPHAPGQGKALPYVLEQKRGKPLVDVGAYGLMPNHLHLLLREINYGGISTFMQKLGTAYSMYFNKKYERVGSLFSGKFKARHVTSDAYLRRLVNYIHANAAELFEPRWKKGKVRNMTKLKKELSKYPYSSFPDFLNAERPHRSILNIVAIEELLSRRPSMETIMDDACTFYQLEIAGENIGQ